jgi:sec-independent protein translocase protein TatA
LDEAMGSFSIWHIIIIVALLALLFGGRGKISGIMGDTAKGIRAFREGLKGEEDHKGKVEEAEEDEPPPKPLPKPKASSTKPASSGSRAKPKAKTKVG